MRVMEIVRGQIRKYLNDEEHVIYKWVKSCHVRKRPLKNEIDEWRVKTSQWESIGRYRKTVKL